MLYANGECATSHPLGSETIMLYIVGTPIGTLTDLSPRAKEVLSSVDVILCEDTRQTGKLLSLLQIQRKGELWSYHQHNETQQKESVVAQWKLNKKIALVSDAGTPCISDPGAWVVQWAHENQIPIQNVPGPSSLVCAMASSGFRVDKWIFAGFLPRSSSQIQASLGTWLLIAPCVVVYLESPKRLLSGLEVICRYFTEDTSLPQVCVSREITKKYEEHIRAPITTAIEVIKQKDLSQGEFTVSMCFEQAPKAVQNSISLQELALIAKHRNQTSGVKLKELCQNLSEAFGFSAKDLYNEVQSL